MREHSAHPGAAVRLPSMLQSLTPIAVLVVLLTLSIILFGADSSQGANQVALTFSAAVAAMIAIFNGERWTEILAAIVNGISTAMGALLILFAIGAMIGTWSMSGTVPAMIYYGSLLLSPTVFYPTACLICALVSVSIGSSWTTAGTIGIGLMGVSQGLGLAPEITAGAVISGAYFGDKMSPLSDTTNLAPAVAGTELFTHIRHMMYTTGPSFLIALAGFAVVSVAGGGPSAEVSLGEISSALEANFDLGWWTLLPLAAVLGLAAARFHALPVILFGALLGAVFAVVFQPGLVAAYGGAEEIGFGLALLKGAWMALMDGYAATTGNAVVDDLLSRGGMSSVLTTIWLIISALTFGAVLEHAGMLQRIIQGVIRAAKSTGALITSVLLTSIGTNIVTGDQYIAIVLPGRMFRAEFRRRRLKARNLSRTIEDAGTLTSPLIPWNTCGAYMATTLGVATLAYLPWAFLNLVNPFVAALLAFRGITIDTVPEGEEMPEVDSATRA
ncbi:Na+/H+ antiporter NhaC [Thioalkalivibrio sp. XN279]|uniref:Na+/H+ antiporter NhaC n=1 Tax=Thioalkalivibrio sp. XN279 TaxID=2714953 RepID=UPI001F0D0C8A|nr:Na+/H+ antiporter NhaC [Thioalkalivibrio sp. XN279]